MRKTCAAVGPGQISCTSSSYSSGVSIHVFPKNEKVRSQWVRFVRTHRPDFQPTDYSYLCSLHFKESCFTGLKLSSLMPTNTSRESGDNSMESGNKGLKEKRVSIRESVPTIHCANKVPEKRESRD